MSTETITTVEISTDFNSDFIEFRSRFAPSATWNASRKTWTMTTDEAEKLAERLQDFADNLARRSSTRARGRKLEQVVAQMTGATKAATISKCGLCGDPVLDGRSLCDECR